MHAHWTLISGFEQAYVDVMYYLSFNVNLQIIFLETPKLFTPYWKAMPLDAHNLCLPLPRIRCGLIFLSDFCFLSSLSEVLLLRMPHRSSRLNHARALKNLIRRPHSSEKGEGKKRLLPCVHSAFYCANVKWFDVMDSSLSKQNLIKICLHFALTLLCVIRLWSFLWPDSNLW